MKVVVIGAGFGGLAAAIRLRARGHDVVVLEQRPEPGGRAAVVRQDGFTFDAGPTIVTAPQMVDELFELAGRARSDYVRLVALDPFYRVRFADGSALDLNGDTAAMETRIAALNPDDVAGFRQFRHHAATMFENAMPLIDEPVGSLAGMLRFAPALVRTRAWRSVAGLVEQCVHDERLRQALSFHPLFIGGHPYRSPALYALIPELERRWGVWYPLGGMGALVRALAALFADQGGDLRCNVAADDILLDRSARRATGVRLRGGEVLPADVVVCNADPLWAHRHLLRSHPESPRALRRLTRQQYGMSVFVLCFGTDRRYDGVAHHEILMAARYRGLLDELFDGRRLPPDFSIYLHRPTATDASLAPAGCDAFYALVPVPNLRADVDWSEAGPTLRAAVLAHLEARLLPALSRHIVTEHAIDPRYFRDALNSPLGSAFSIEPRLTQSAWFRPHNASDLVANLYFVGAGTHPGAGIPGVLSSASIADRLIAARERELSGARTDRLARRAESTAARV